VIIGTQALKDPPWFRKLVERHPGRIVLGLDARNGRVATEGWLDVSSVEAVTLAEQFDALPLAAVVYTDIACDGMLQGPNLSATEALARRLRAPVIASGGVGSLDDVGQLATLPIAGCIVGRALYEGRLRLSEARERAGDRSPTP
jgi:phosphoribosylformimino-5-aminoimidazole carboxamide ribotide isomerase